MYDSFWLAVNPAHNVASISASDWFFTVVEPVKVEYPPTCSVPLNCAFPALLIVATVVSLAPPDPMFTLPLPELFDPFSTPAPVPAALITVWLLVLDCPLLYCPIDILYTLFSSSSRSEEHTSELQSLRHLV